MLMPRWLIFLYSLKKWYTLTFCLYDIVVPGGLTCLKLEQNLENPQLLGTIEGTYLPNRNFKCKLF
jgi:hypothetical protein